MKRSNDIIIFQSLTKLVAKRFESQTKAKNYNANQAQIKTSDTRIILNKRCQIAIALIQQG
jgi:hypothetical protein